MSSNETNNKTIAKELLTELRRRGKKVFLFSNAQSCFTVPELKALGIYDCFDGVMIGNDEFADIRGAMGAGMDACYIQTEQSPSFPISLPSPRISVLREIIE